MLVFSLIITSVCFSLRYFFFLFLTYICFSFIKKYFTFSIHRNRRYSISENTRRFLELFKNYKRCSNVKAKLIKVKRIRLNEIATKRSQEKGTYGVFLLLHIPILY